MISKVINDIIDNNVSQCSQRFHVIISRFNYLYYCCIIFLANSTLFPFNLYRTYLSNPFTLRDDFISYFKKFIYNILYIGNCCRYPVKIIYLTAPIGTRCLLTM